MKQKKLSLLLASLLILLISPPGALAQSVEADDEAVTEGSVTLGAGVVGSNNKSSKLGEYSGITESEGYAVGDAEIFYQRGSLYMHFLGEDLGLENRSVSLESGTYGKLKFFADWDQLPHELNNNTQTSFKGIGGTNLTLPAGFGKTGDATTLTIADPDGEDLRIEGRRAGNFGFSGKLGLMDVSFSYMRETKDGIVDIGTVVGTSPGGNSISLPGLLDQTTNEVRGSVAHNGEDSQIQFDFFMSLFDNQAESISWESPYTGTNNGTGIMSRAPDNRFIKFSLSGAKNLPYNSRVSGIMEYSHSSQDQDLLAFAQGTSTSLLPRSSAGAEIHTAHLNINAASRPLPKLGLRARYRHYQTINVTDQSLFLYMRNDSETTQAASTADEAMTNLTYDYIQDRIELGATYDVLKATTLKLDYDFELYNRDYREAQKTMEHSIKAGIRSQYFSFAEVGYNVQLSFKEEDDYDATRVFQATHTQDHIDAGTTFDNLLDSKRFDIASRDRMKHSAHINFFPSETTTLGLYYNWAQDDYEDTNIGLNFNRNQEVTLDLGFSPNPLTQLHFFYSFEEIQSEHTGREWGTNVANSETDLTKNWTGNQVTHAHTAGFGGNYVLIKEKLDLKLDYSFSLSEQDIDFDTGSNALVTGSVGLPDIQTTQHRLDVTGIYKWSKKLDLGLKYIFGNYRTDDFATDSLAPGTAVSTSFVLMTGTVPDYTAHSTITYATYRF
jgi:MtrB/PioB family decaheme-associated outer membrane protein